jgi:glycosyltransferase involved in cell wall biosynthesis
MDVFLKNKNHKKKLIISIVTPCFNEENNIDACYKEVKRVMEKDLPNFSYEHIFCDNNSSDKTLEKIKAIAKKDKNIKLIAYSRNFGAFASVFNGMLRATGDAIIPMLAADLQDPPSVIPKMVKLWRNGYKVIYGQRKNRQEGCVMKLFRNLYYLMVEKSSNVKVHKNVGEFTLIDKKVQDVLRDFDDYFPYLRGMISSCGFKSAFVQYKWGVRKEGVSTGSPLILINDAINGLISFTNLPMRLCMFGGIIVSSLSLLYVIYSLIVVTFLPTQAAPGISLIITAIFLFFGITFIFLGILGEYISAIHFQVRKKPLVVIEETVNFKK